jgi:hypothetical protein
MYKKWVICHNEHPYRLRLLTPSPKFGMIFLNMSIRTHHVIATLLAGAVVLSSLAWFGFKSPTAEAACSTGVNIVLTAPIPGATLSGSQTLVASTAGTSTVPTSISFVITAPTSQVLAQIAPGGSNNTSWSASWDSRSIVDGSYQLAAVAHYGTSSTYDCPSVPVPVIVHNSTATGTQNPTLTADISPNNWQGIPGAKQTFTITGVYTNQFGTQYPVTPAAGATFVWGTNAGTLDSVSGSGSTLTSGPAFGSFNIGTKVTMNGLTTNASATVKIVEPGTNSGSGSTTPGSGSTPKPPASPTPQPADGTAPTNLTPAQLQVLETTPTIFRPTPGNTTNSNPVVPIQTLGCLEQQLGSQFAAISGGTVKPSTDERLKAATCFSGSAKIPSTLAPVEPVHLTETPTNTGFITIAGIKNDTVTGKDGKKSDVIKLSGTGTPSSSVFLYIFSDPMVLRAETDNQGKWNYTLDNPLKPGHHEIYAVAQKDASSFVRTPAVPVAIAAASPGNQDGSLVIEHTLQPMQIAYIAGAVAMVLAAIFLVFRLRRRKPAAAQPVPSGGTPTVQPAVTPAPAAAAPAAPTASPAPAQPPAAPTLPTPPANHGPQA